MGKSANRYLEFEQALINIRNLLIKSRSEYKKLIRLDKSILYPLNPNVVYKDKGWVSWSHWLGNNSEFFGKREFVSYDESKLFVSSIGISTKIEWECYYKLNNIKNIPRCPNLAYKDKGWISWSDWFGVKSRSDISFMSIDKAREMIKLNNISSKTLYLNFYKNAGLPSNPISTYKLEKWSDILCEKIITIKSNNYLEYSQAKEIVNRFRLKSQKYWYKLCKADLIPTNIPKTPNKFYKEWVSWNDWLGHSITTYKTYLSYDEAKLYLSNINITSLQEYYDYLIFQDLNYQSNNIVIYPFYLIDT
jgi:hypothetical protein